MKTFIIAAVSADGFIAKDKNHPAFWTSKEDKARFVKLTKEAGVIVMGSNTYNTLHRPLKDRRNIVYSKQIHSGDPKYEGAEVTQESARALVERLTGEGVAGLAICGGSQIYTMFLKEKLVEKIYLTIEPILFGKGISLFNDATNTHLRLVAAEGTASGSLLLEYDVDYHGAVGNTSV